VRTRGIASHALASGPTPGCCTISAGRRNIAERRSTPVVRIAGRSGGACRQKHAAALLSGPMGCGWARSRSPGVGSDVCGRDERSQANQRWYGPWKIGWVASPCLLTPTSKRLTESTGKPRLPRPGLLDFDGRALRVSLRASIATTPPGCRQAAGLHPDFSRTRAGDEISPR
jgi:hypothetical protein